jgi:hypothetical protein
MTFVALAAAAGLVVDSGRFGKATERLGAASLDADASALQPCGTNCRNMFLF